MLGRHSLIILLILLFLPSVTWAITSPVFLHIVTEHSPPYQEQKRNRPVQGLTTELVKAVLAGTPYHYQINIYPWSRAFMMAKERPNTCIYLMSRNEQREKHFQWIAPILSVNDYLIGLADRDGIALNSLEDAKNYNVAVLKDDRTYYMLLDQGFEEHKNLYVINNTYSLLKLLLTRKNIDFIIADTINVEYRAKYNGMDPNLFRAYYKITENPVDLYLACSLTTPKPIIETLKKSLATIKHNGVYDQIMNYVK
ncbi:transporter substrate-binding domain-containing protein [Thalassotalea sp. G2M2-11]|uniref:substrate-binding periplasmic protein n=1 Tax=Thalassotalea sp. G2M2-11 TaxID=2787627 RepID=UPI0019D29990|nr:transporter substrate-binding domain-containing protein [Thalassotalea sp. G2M2-11]